MRSFDLILRFSVYKKANLGFSKKFTESVVLYDVTEKLYRNEYFKFKHYDDFEYEFFEMPLSEIAQIQ